jgi:hypothetical protein
MFLCWVAVAEMWQWHLARVAVAGWQWLWQTVAAVVVVGLPLLVYILVFY